jgi:hypothetical protein
MIQINCDRFQNCSANICPLDPEWFKRKHLNGDRVCFYLIEAQKTNAKAIFDTCGRGYVFEAMQRVTPNIIERYSIIKRALEQSKKTGSRMARKIGVTI